MELNTCIFFNTLLADISWLCTYVYIQRFSYFINFDYFVATRINQYKVPVLFKYTNFIYQLVRMFYKPVWNKGSKCLTLILFNVMLGEGILISFFQLCKFFFHFMISTEERLFSLFKYCVHNLKLSQKFLIPSKRPW